MALMRESPSLVMAMTVPPRALASCTLPSIFSNTESSGASATTGMFSSINAIGPCFISPAGYPSAWMYGDLLQLERTFERNRVVESTSKKEKVPARIELVGHPFHGRGCANSLLDDVRQLEERIDVRTHLVR